MTPDHEANLTRLIEPTILPGLDLAVGVVFVQGAGYRVGAVSIDGLRHMSAAAARRYARDLEATPHAEQLRPAIEAVRAVADEVDRIMADPYTPDERALARMPSQGRA